MPRWTGGRRQIHRRGQCELGGDTGVGPAFCHEPEHIASIFGKLFLEPEAADNRRVLAVLRYLRA
jgi:hypothetical protein